MSINSLNNNDSNTNRLNNTIFDLSRSPFRSVDETDLVFNYLEQRTLLEVDLVSRAFRSIIESYCQRQSNKRGLIPASLPKGVSYKQLLLNRFPNAVCPGFYRDHFGKVDVVPIPRVLIERAQPGFKLVYIPDTITIEVDENSPLMLDFKTAVGGKKARLIENPDRRNLEPTGIIQKITVPITLNNLLFLAQKCLKKNFPSQFAGISFVSEGIITQHGDSAIGPSHYSYQKKEVMGLGQPYKEQVELAAEVDLEIVSLVDRLFFRLTKYMQTGQFPQGDYVECSSTPIDNYIGEAWHSVIWWPASGPSFCLHLGTMYDLRYGGAAAGVPAGSS